MRSILARLSPILAAGLLLAVLPAGPAAAYPRPLRVERVSVGTGGAEGNGQAAYGTISADARYVVFASHASNLVEGDTNGRSDVFVRDRVTGTTRRVSVASDGTQGNDDALSGSISADGRYVAFFSWSTNLVPDAEAARGQIFVHDIQTGTTTLVSRSTAGHAANFFTFDPMISADGRFVTFESAATNLVPNDTNLSWDPTNLTPADVFVRDLVANTTERVSVATDGTESNGNSRWPMISPDGRYVTFASTATNLVLPDANVPADPLFRGEDVYLHDRETGVTEIVSVSSNGIRATGASFGFAPMTPDGRYVAFFSQASNLVPNDSNRVQDAFVRDRVNGTTERVSVSSSGAESNNSSIRPSISADGRYVAFSSTGTNLVPHDTNPADDVFVHDRHTGETRLISMSDVAKQAAGQNFVPTMSSDGRFVSFTAYGALVGSDGNQTYDTYLVDNGPALGLQSLSVASAGSSVKVSGAVVLGPVIATSRQDEAGDSSSAVAATDLTEVSVAYRPEAEDLRVVWRTTDMPSVSSAAWTQPSAGGAPGTLYTLSFYYADVAWRVEAALVPSDGDTATPRFRLSRCTPTCTVVSSLRGGLGTTGESVTVSVPVSLLGDGTTMSSIEASAMIPGANVVRGTVDSVALPESSYVGASVAVDVVPTGTASNGVNWQPAALENGRFSTYLPNAPNNGDVWVRVCRAGQCITETRPIG